MWHLGTDNFFVKGGEMIVKGSYTLHQVLDSQCIGYSILLCLFCRIGVFILSFKGTCTV